MCICTLIWVCHKTLRKFHKIIQKHGVSFGRIPSKESKGITKCHRTPHILLDIVFPIDSMLLAKIDICTNENLYWRNWLCEPITGIFLFIIILIKNSFWRELWLEKVTALWLKANWWCFCHWWSICAKEDNN